ncbi:polymer-forming cytoskeletal protein [Porticoccaceae bacterium]|jgi:cytoskeletal protein CcmA (bactofilin family)|nr:polymer-forming cytoskeletal protein [Porticoccaceae bacterium]MDB4428096.1 polymer-forming cytoskeletal protein [Porticoccaceae bacterium]MDC0589058.1 polymer-forming cytoskeletal protein [Porticoccaceae bacterium]
MFGTNNSNNPNSSGSTTLIAEGTRLTGDIAFSGNLEIEGAVVGNITSSDENAKIRILNSGSVTGDIEVANIVINGNTRGDLYASQLIKLAAKAVVQGNVNYKLIEIEKGAEVVGSFVYHQKPNNVTQFPADSKELGS